MQMDALSVTLAQLSLKSFVAGTTDVAGRCAIEVPHYTGLKLYLMLEGDGWVTVAGRKTPLHVKTGDCLLLSGGKPFVFATDPSIKRAMRIEDLQTRRKGGAVTINGGGERRLAAINFELDGHFQRLLFAHLPQDIHVQAAHDEAAVIRWSIEQFRNECLGDGIGRLLFLQQLAPIILLQMFRAYIGQRPDALGWLQALTDSRLGLAVAKMHTQYDRAWTLESLARVAGMSRAAFALNFKKQLGIAPLEYLTQWRMQVACNLLKSADKRIAEVAGSVGYGSESAFSLAFKKVVKCRPGAFQRRHWDR